MRDLEELARAVPGGSAARPLEVSSAAQVEPIASATACPLCQGGLLLEEHRADTIDGVRLRVTAVRCTTCGVRRSLYFRLVGVAPG